MSITQSLHLLDKNDNNPAAYCKACGRLIIKSDKEDAPKFTTDEDMYWRMQSDVRCSPLNGDGKDNKLAYGGP